MSYSIVNDKGNVISKKYDKNRSLTMENPQFNQDKGIQNFVEPSDVAEAMKNLNDDTLDENNFSSIDMKTRLHPMEISGIIVVDTLVAMGFLPRVTSTITRSKKRLAVSQNGKGRTEMVDLFRSVNEQKQGSSLLDNMMGKD